MAITISATIAIKMMVGENIYLVEYLKVCSLYHFLESLQERACYTENTLKYNFMEWHSYLVWAIPILVGILAQFTKFILFTFKNGWQPSYVFTHGHMPSAHTAFALSLPVLS